MAYKDELIWLKGKKLAVCEPDAVQFECIKSLLENYGLEVVGLNSIEAMVADLESRRYSTHRVYLAVLVTADLALDLESAWLNILKVNPEVAQAPLVLMASQTEKRAVAEFIERGYFKFQIDRPITALQLLRVLRRLNRWKAIGGTKPEASFPEGRIDK